MQRTNPIQSYFDSTVCVLHEAKIALLKIFTPKTLSIELHLSNTLRLPLPWRFVGAGEEAEVGLFYLQPFPFSLPIIYPYPPLFGIY